MENVIAVLKARGFLEALTDEELGKILSQPTKVYCGFDPTSDSLHLGNMVAIMGLAWFQKFGHTPYILLGGATGMIGDPSGKDKERQLLDEKTLQENVLGIQKNFEKILDWDHPTAKPIMVNNWDWFKGVGFVSFLRDVGKCFRLGSMLAKDSVRTRLQSEEGMSFTEFSYPLLQGYDFYYLCQNHGVLLQIGGSDQWGNITAGIDLTKKLCGKEVYGVTLPLLTTSEGKKFGKSEEGAIWLSPEKLSPYQFYQHLIRVQDADVIKLMKRLTFMPLEEIALFEEEMLKPDAIPNKAQKKLAEEVTLLVHGEAGLKAALSVTEAASPGRKAVLNGEILEAIAADMPSETVSSNEVISCGVVEVLVRVGLASSKGEARRLIRNGGLYLNNEKMVDENRTVLMEDLIDSRLLLLAIGKKNKKLIRVEFL